MSGSSVEDRNRVLLFKFDPVKYAFHFSGRGDVRQGSELGHSNSELVWLGDFGYYLSMILDKIPALRELSWMEKLELVDELWSDVRSDVSFDVRHEEIVAELERRRAEYASSPDSVVEWHDIKRRLAV